MPFLQIDDLTVEVGSLTEDEPVDVGSIRRAFAGNLRDGRRGYRRRWHGTTGPLSEANAQLFKAKAHEGFQDCTGDALASQTIRCHVKVNDSAFIRNGISFLRLIDFTLDEAGEPPVVQVLTTLELSPTPITLDL